jgi:hypothetical protein
MRTYTIPLFGLLALMVLQTGGLWMGIKSLQVLRVLQQEIRVKSNPSNAVQFTLSKKEFESYSIDDGNELKIKGNMFDVVSIDSKEDSVIISAIEDHFEAHLIAILIQSAESNDKNPPRDAYLLALMHLQFIPPVDSTLELWQNVSLEQNGLIEFKEACHSAFLQRPEQPPENKSKTNIPVFSFV